MDSAPRSGELAAQQIERLEAKVERLQAEVERLRAKNNSQVAKTAKVEDEVKNLRAFVEQQAELGRQ